MIEIWNDNTGGSTNRVPPLVETPLVQIKYLSMDSISSISFPNKPLISRTFLYHFCHHFWVVLAGWWIGVAVPLYPPKRDDKNGQEMFN